MKQVGLFFSLKLRLMKHGPNDERGFGLVTGVVAASLLVLLAYLTVTQRLDIGWLALAYFLWGLLWLLAPLIQPTYTAPVLLPEWFRMLPGGSQKIAGALSWTELFGIGPFITALGLSSLIVLALPLGSMAVLLAVIALFAQTYFLVWLGKTAATFVRRVMQTRFGLAIAALQMSVLLAVMFVGWVPVLAVIFPGLISGDTTPAQLGLTGNFPDALYAFLSALPTNWGLNASLAAIKGSFDLALLSVAGLLIAGAVLHLSWVVLSSDVLRRPPERLVNKVTVRHAKKNSYLLAFIRSSTVAAVVMREIATWFRDPSRSLELRHAWLTPLFMVVIIAVFSDWIWALPFIGIMAVSFGTMAAVNTYALDGTALWQQLTIPGAVRADILGRQIAWFILFGVPALLFTTVLIIISQSPLSIMAMSGVIVAIGIACAVALLLAVVMPAIGTDARLRVRTGQGAGNATGGQMTIFTIVLLVSGLAILPIAGSWFGDFYPAYIVLSVALALIGNVLATRSTESYLRRHGVRLFQAMKAGDGSLLRKSSEENG